MKARAKGDLACWIIALALMGVAGWILFAGMTDAETAFWSWSLIAGIALIGVVATGTDSYRKAKKMNRIWRGP